MFEWGLATWPSKSASAIQFLLFRLHEELFRMDVCLSERNYGSDSGALHLQLPPQSIAGMFERLLDRHRARSGRGSVYSGAHHMYNLLRAKMYLSGGDPVLREVRPHALLDYDRTLPLTWHDLFLLAGPPTGTEHGEWTTFLTSISHASNIPRESRTRFERVAQYASLLAVLLYAVIALIALQHRGWLAAAWAALFLVGTLRAMVAQHQASNMSASGSASGAVATDARVSDRQYRGPLTTIGLAWLVHWKPGVLDRLSVGLSRRYITLPVIVSMFMCGLGFLGAMIPAYAKSGMMVMLVATVALTAQGALAIRRGHRLLTIATHRIMNQRCLYCGYPLMPIRQAAPGSEASGWVQCSECGTSSLLSNGRGTTNPS